MRRTLALLLAFGLLLAPLALAKGASDDDGDADEPRGRRHGGHGADDVAARNESSDDDANETRGAGRRGAHHADGADDENETDDDDARGRGHAKRAFRAEFVSQLAQLRASWLENATAIREACHAAEKDENATKEERLDRAHCIRDGYHAFFETLRELLRDLRASRRAASE